MSNSEAVEELFRIINHIGRAGELVGFDVTKQEVQHAERQSYDTIDGLIHEMT